MAIVRARNPLRWVRRILLALGILGCSLFGLLLAAYQFGSAGRVEEGEGEIETSAGSANVDEGTVTAGEGFDYTQTSEGRQVFRIRADRSRQDREDWAYLEEVQLEIYRDDGEASTVTSRRARVHQKTWDAELEGDVVLRGWEDLELKARALEIRDGARVLVSVGAVQFDYPPNLTGRATRLRIDRKTDTIQLTGGVHIRSKEPTESPLRMDCDRLVYRRDEGLIRAFDDIYLRYGKQELQTQALSLFLQDADTTEPATADGLPRLGGEGGQRLRLLRARWDVTGRLAAADPEDPMSLLDGQQAEFAGQLLEIEPDPRDPAIRNVRLEGGEEGPAVIKISDASGLARRLTGQLLKSRLRDGTLRSLEGFGAPLLLDEFLDLEEPFPLRQACARQALALFLADGSPGRFELRQAVELRDEELYLSGGSSAALDLERGRLEIQGPAVELYNDRGVITSPSFSYSRDKGVIHATSGVRALLEPTATFQSTPLGNGEGPIRVESREATWTENPQTFAFRGGVRAWRGQNLLLADQLRGDERLQEMAASGNVKTVWLSSGSPSSSGPLPSTSREPIEITAGLLSYQLDRLPAQAGDGKVRIDEGGATLVYSGGVTLRQSAQVIRCRELSLELERSGDRPDAAREPQRMICRDEVHLTDDLGQEVRGDTAIYSVPQRLVEIFGDVRLSDKSQNTLSGRYLLYNLDASSVELRSRTPSVDRTGR